MQDRTYTIGRLGEICLDGVTVSNRHAELQVLNNEIYLTDLNSTNGTYLLNGEQKIPFQEGYVQADQQVLFGHSLWKVSDLLAAVGEAAPKGG
ncbi:MAG: FHA domain-containing protein [Gammaproteobacteria bacterium]|nr:FHA domain-containing protein [Gammaproteobacteria bacterium]